MRIIVLIVDDDEAVCFLHKVIVSQSKLSTETQVYRNAREALNYLDQHFNKNETYLVLLDINMPVMNGWDFLEVLTTKSYNSQVYTVMVTSSVDRSDREKAKLYNGVIDFVEKPISEEACKRIMNLTMLAPFFNAGG